MSLDVDKVVDLLNSIGFDVAFNLVKELLDKPAFTPDANVITGKESEPDRAKKVEQPSFKQWCDGNRELYSALMSQGLRRHEIELLWRGGVFTQRDRPEPQAVRAEFRRQQARQEEIRQWEQAHPSFRPPERRRQVTLFGVLMVVLFVFIALMFLLELLKSGYFASGF